MIFIFIILFLFQGHIICQDCYNHLLNTLNTRTTRSGQKQALCVTCKGEKYCGRPVVLEQVLGLQDDKILIESDSD